MFFLGLLVGFALGWLIRPFTGKILKGVDQVMEEADKDLRKKD